MQNVQEKAKNVGCTCINPTPDAHILHPILPEIKSATNVTVAQRASHSTSETIVISEADAAKIRKDAETAIGNDEKLRQQKVSGTPDARILHPILHPKLSVNTGHLAPWCRKCRRFSKTFFVERREGGMRCSGPETAKHRTSLGKSTDVLHQKYGCFHRRSPMFLFSGKDIPHP